jgi:Fe-S-cluster containining protein
MQPSHQDSPPWYEGGLSFECTRCGACCTGEEGFVWLNEEEIDRLAQRVDLRPDEFLKVYAKRVGKRISLRERENGDCVFWHKNVGCSVYEDRPRQCRTWPFWNSNIASPEDWERTKQSCPGTGMGRLYTVEEILAQSKVIDI